MGLSLDDQVLINHRDIAFTNITEERFIVLLSRCQYNINSTFKDSRHSKSKQAGPIKAFDFVGSLLKCFSYSIRSFPI